MVERKRFPDETTLVKSPELAKTMTASLPIDLLPTYFTQVESEVMNLLLFWQTDLTPKYIENVIQTVYIFDRAIQIRVTYSSGLVKDPFLENFLTLFLAYKGLIDHPHIVFAKKGMDLDAEKRFIAFVLKSKYFTPDNEMPVEKKKLKLVAEINKIVSKPLAIPSHRAISNALLDLEAVGYVRRKEIRTKTLWNVGLTFLQMRMERHRQIIDEFVKLKNESKGSTKEEQERDAMAILFDKYSPALLELLGIEYWKYLTNKEPISLVLRYMNDVQQLTLY